MTGQAPLSAHFCDYLIGSTDDLLITKPTHKGGDLSSTLHVQYTQLYLDQ